MLALDPVLFDIDFGKSIVIVAIKVLIIFVIGLVGTMLMVWFERKIIAGMQNRIGPNKAGPYGLLQTLADGMKLIFKEDLLPNRADRIVFRVAPFLAFVPAFLVWSVLPLGGDFRDGKSGVIRIFGKDTLAQLADPPMGILLLLALSGIAVYGIVLAGWASGSKYPLLGSVRATAQMVSYEASLGLSIAAVILVAGTLSTHAIVAAQSGLSNWMVVSTGVVPFVLFLISATAELNRPPFDLVEAEQELVGGFNTEYSAFMFALFYLAEFMNSVTMSGVIVTLFFGGPQPLSFKIGALEYGGWLPFGPLSGTVWFLLKLLVFLYVYVWLRGTLPRLRYDQLMNLGWKVLIPSSLGWFIVLAAQRVGDDNDWNPVVVTVITLAVLAACAGLLLTAVRTSSKNREREGAMF
ncbi:MAG TPA: NADH-quinone oxidoreductase subunit H [Ilumatobacteraceae bacterium]|nr:NADH-quinone oxidoreductase subunit H [Ilumatobacteraceae bacterium]